MAELAGFSFKRYGRSWHPIIATAADLQRVPDLDEALWIATAAPVASLEADPTFLQLVDADGDGRIRAEELRAAIRWLFSVVKDTAGISAGSTSLKLAALDPAGGRLLEAATGVAREVGASGEITLEQVRTVKAEEAARGLFEAGKVLPASAGDDAELRAFLEHAIEVVGSVPHPRGEAITPELLARFLAEARAWLDWKDTSDQPEVHPLGEATGAAVALVDQLSAKFDQYFLLCDAVRLDPALADRCWPTGDGVDLLDAAASTAFLGRAPLLRPRPDGVVDLAGALNPAYVDALRTFDQQVRGPLLGGGTTLDRDGWRRIQAALAPHRAWVAKRPGTAIGGRGVDVIRRHAEDAALEAGAKRLFDDSVRSAAVFAAVGEVEKAILYQAWLLKLTNNFVSHPELYDLGKRAFYEMGTLILDGRRFNLAVRVPDAARHEKFTAASAMFVMYVQVGTKGGSWDYEVAVPVTAGERGNLAEGLWGLFIDNQGVERHALVRKVIANPISIREAIVQPFYRAAASVQALLDKQAADADAAASSALSEKATGAASAALTAPGSALKPADPAAAPAAPAASAAAAPPAAMGAAQIASLAAAGGIALAAVAQVLATISTAFWSGVVYVAETFTALPFLSTVLPAPVIGLLSAPVGILLTAFAFVSAPLMFYVLPVAISTWFKLRRRDLAAMLEGAGWALNTRMYLTGDLAGLFTQKPTIPPSRMEM